MIGMLKQTYYTYLCLKVLANKDQSSLNKDKIVLRWNEIGMYVFLEGLLACLSLLGRHTRGSFYRDGKRSILGMLTPGDFQGGQWGYEFQNEWSRCRRHTVSCTLDQITKFI